MYIFVVCVRVGVCVCVWFTHIYHVYCLHLCNASKNGILRKMPKHRFPFSCSHTEPHLNVFAHPVDPSARFAHFTMWSRFWVRVSVRVCEKLFHLMNSKYWVEASQKQRKKKKIANSILNSTKSRCSVSVSVFTMFTIYNHFGRNKLSWTVSECVPVDAFLFVRLFRSRKASEIGFIWYAQKLDPITTQPYFRGLYSSISLPSVTFILLNSVAAPIDFQSRSVFSRFFSLCMIYLRERKICECTWRDEEDLREVDS